MLTSQRPAGHFLSTRVLQQFADKLKMGGERRPLPRSDECSPISWRPNASDTRYAVPSVQ